MFAIDYDNKIMKAKKKIIIIIRKILNQTPILVLLDGFVQ